MAAGWVAGAVWSRAMAGRRLGSAAARQVAACPSLAAALDALTSSPYRRELVANASLADAQDALAATVVWNMRVLAGWLPADGGTSPRGRSCCRHRRGRPAGTRRWIRCPRCRA